MRCLHCGRPMIHHTGSYDYTECGLPVRLHGIAIWQCEKCKDETPVIPNITGLHLTIGLVLAQKDRPLEAKEIAFMRQALGLSASAYARMLGVSKGTVSDWEKGEERPRLANDKNIRRAYVLNILERDDEDRVELGLLNEAINSLHESRTGEPKTVEVSYSQGVATLSGQRSMPPAWLPRAPRLSAAPPNRDAV